MVQIMFTLIAYELLLNITFKICIKILFIKNIEPDDFACDQLDDLYIYI